MTSHPTEDGIKYARIRFPPPIENLDKLEAQNENIAINVSGWQHDRVTVHRTSEKPKCVQRINLMMTGSREMWHYSYVERVSALLHDQTNYQGGKHYCLRSLSRFTPE